MSRSARLVPVLLAFGVVLAACGAGPAPAAPAPPPATATPSSQADVAAAAPTDEPVAVATPADWLNTVTPDGDYYVLGNPAAPVRLLDYSDFL